jgi:hypothetical protein
VDGITRLLCLSLEGQPAAEVIQGTVSSWADAIWPGKVWLEDRDTPRIRESFRVLARTCRRWPTPSQFLEAYPRGESPVLKLKKIESDDDRAKASRHISDILKKLNLGSTETQP